MQLAFFFLAFALLVGVAVWYIVRRLKQFEQAIPKVKAIGKCKCGRPVTHYHGEPEAEKDCHFCRLRSS